MPAIALVIVILGFGVAAPLHAAKFHCSSGDVTCLIAAINQANEKSGQHTITLDPGIYTLQTTDNMIDGANGLPSMRRAIRILPSVDDAPTVIERDPGAQSFRIFHVARSGRLTVTGITVARGEGPSGMAIFNLGVTTLQDSVITNSTGGERGAIYNSGKLKVLRTIISDNSAGHEGGGIRNDGIAHVENSTIAHNSSSDGGGIENTGSLVVKNSAVIFNTTDCCQPGGGIFNVGGTVQIVNSTIAKNFAGGGGGGVANFNGQVSITNSTIRENEAPRFFSVGGGLWNESGTLQLKNTIVAGNTVDTVGGGPDCFGNIISLGNNLVGDTGACTIQLQPRDLTGEPGLDDLVGAGEEDSPGSAHYPVLADSAVIDNGNSNACLKHDQSGHLRAGTCDIGAVEFGGLVAIDIWPKKDARQINLGSNNGLEVAILSLNGFDATTVDATTVLFGRTGVEASPAAVVLKDVNKDGLVDMLLSFNVGTMGMQCGDTRVALTGETNNGQPIGGFDSIKIVGCKK